MAEVTCVWARTWVSVNMAAERQRCVGFPTKNFPKERVFCLFQVNRIPSILFILLSGAEWTEWYSIHSKKRIAFKRTQSNTVYFEYSYSRIAPKACALRQT